jgi:hypothetical protein
MPKFLEDKLRANVPKGVDADRYVYGAMNNMGAMHGNKETAKGRAMEAKHARDTSHPVLKLKKRTSR